MSYDGFVTAAIAAQLNRTLSGARIDKIYQPEREELQLMLHDSGRKYRLLLSASGGNARLHLTGNESMNPENPSAFCMLLRKHFQGGKITAVRQISSERVIEIVVEHVNEMGFPVQKSLFSEIMGKHSNIIAVDRETGKIIDCIKRISPDISRVRQLLPGLPYEMPPDQGKIPFYGLTEASLEAVLSCPGESPQKKLLQGISGLSPAACEELCFLASTSDGLSAPALLSVMEEQILRIANAPESVVYLDREGIPVDFHVFPLHALEGCYEAIRFPLPDEAVDYYFSHRDSANRIRQRSSDLSRSIRAALDKLLLKKQRLLEDLLKAEDADTFRLFGELLTTALHQITPGAAEALVSNYYKDGELLAIPLDPRLSAAKNAQKYYKKYGKAKTAVKEKKIQLDEVNEAVEYLESVLSFAENAESVEEMMLIRDELAENGYLRRRKDKYQPSRAKLKPTVYSTSDGFKILVGRNNRENDKLTFKTADKRDLWFHTKDIPGSHVILLTEGREASETAIFEAAALAAYFSKARASENVPVDYVRIRHVKKPAGAKPGKVIFTDNRTVYVTPRLCKKAE